MWKLSNVAVVCLASALFAFTSGAQTYPDKPVRVIVPAPPGGALDIVARYVTQKLGEPFGTQFIVDNRGGAGGGIGADVAARAVPDGYTLLLSSSSAVSVNPHFVPKAADPLKVFAPIVLVGFSPNVLVIHPSVPAKSAKELIAVAKARPDALAFGSNGAGSLSHLTGALFMQRAGIRMLHVPYKGAAPAVIDTMAGNVSVLFAAYASASAQARTGKLRALAVTSAKRVEIAPDLPTIAESALPGFESTQWWGVYGPSGLQGNIVTRLNAELNRILSTPETRKRFAAEGAEPAGGTAAELAAYHKVDYEKWGAVIRSAGIKGE
ncbi:MAG: Bug family tripartite tricarboxylate transporter substrate binding protein [Burkholderiales bacterium]